MSYSANSSCMAQENQAKKQPSWIALLTIFSCLCIMYALSSFRPNLRSPKSTARKELYVWCSNQQDKQGLLLYQTPALIVRYKLRIVDVSENDSACLTFRSRSAGACAEMLTLHARDSDSLHFCSCWWRWVAWNAAELAYSFQVSSPNFRLSTECWLMASCWRMACSWNIGSKPFSVCSVHLQCNDETSLQAAEELQYLSSCLLNCTLLLYQNLEYALCWIHRSY